MVHEEVVDPVQPAQPWQAAFQTAQAAQQLVGENLHARKALMQMHQIRPMQWLLILGSMLAWIMKPEPAPLEQGVTAPWFAEDAPAAWFDDPSDLRRRILQVEVVQDGMSPDSVKRVIGKGKAFPCRLYGLHLGRHVIGHGPLDALVNITA